MAVPLPEQSDIGPKWTYALPMADNGTLLIQDLMRFLPDGLTANGWAVKAGVSRTIWADMRRHGNPSRRTLEKLLGAAGSSLAEFEALRVGESSIGNSPIASNLADPGATGWRPAPLAPIPLLATGLTGEWGEEGSGIELTSIDLSNAVGRVDRPPRLASDRESYALTVAGEAMWPRFRRGRRLLVSPASPVGIGDDVVVMLGDAVDPRNSKVLIKELVGQSASYVELRQFNPDTCFRVDAAMIWEIHKIVGEVI
jgi:phage repressor protein C with HTH and peptisase S24 domain